MIYDHWNAALSLLACSLGTTCGLWWRVTLQHDHMLGEYTLYNASCHCVLRGSGSAVLLTVKYIQMVHHD